MPKKKDQKNKYIVLDGKQRLLAIEQFLSAYYDNSQEFKLKGLTVYPELNNKTPKEAFDLLSKRTGVEDFDGFENNTIRAVFIRNWPTNEYLYQVFNRLNTGAVQLSPQELRISLYPGKFTDYILDKSSNVEILNLLQLSEPDKRMRDVELVLRFFAFHYFLKDYNGKLKMLLDKTAKTLNDDWISRENELNESFNQLIEAIKFAREVFTEKLLFVKPNSSSKSKKIILVLFESFTYYFAIPEVRENIRSIAGYKDKMKIMYGNLFSDSKFLEAIESHTSDREKVILRFEKIASAINGILAKGATSYKVNSPLVISQVK